MIYRGDKIGYFFNDFAHCIYDFGSGADAKISTGTFKTGRGKIFYAP